MDPATLSYIGMAVGSVIVYALGHFNFLKLRHDPTPPAPPSDPALPPTDPSKQPPAPPNSPPKHPLLDALTSQLAHFLSQSSTPNMPAVDAFLTLLKNLLTQTPPKA